MFLGLALTLLHELFVASPRKPFFEDLRAQPVCISCGCVDLLCLSWFSRSCTQPVTVQCSYPQRWCRFPRCHCSGSKTKCATCKAPFHVTSALLEYMLQVLR